MTEQMESMVLTEPRVQAKETAPADYYPWFDWLRFGLAAVVMLSHMGLINAWPQAGNFAVQVFFALSGWLVGGILITLPKAELHRFYYNRALRIWCPYFIALALLVSASLIRDHVTHKWTEIVFYKLTFVYNLFGPRQLAQHRLEMPLGATGNHFWSVNAEEQFYLLAPLLLVLVPRRYGRNVITWVTLAVVAWVSKTYASIIFGVLAAVIAHTYGAFHKHYRCRVVAAAVFALTVVAFVAGMDYDLVAPLCATALMLLFAIHGKQHRFGALAGGMSYPLYLNAWVPAFVVNALMKRVGLTSRFSNDSLILALNLGFAAFLYWYVDRRVLANRKRLYTPKRAWITMGLAYGAVTLGLVVGILMYLRSDRSDRVSAAISAPVKSLSQHPASQRPEVNPVQYSLP
jgi:peptidoglycan/LPS O-acetylase OafA/YrhL